MNSRPVPVHILLLLCGVTLAVFSRVPFAEFVNYDDHVHIYKNPYLNPVTPAGVLHFWVNPFDGVTPERKEDLYNTPYEQLYAPLTFTAWALIATQARLPQEVDTLDIGPHSLRAAPFHWFSVILHVLNVLLVFAVLRVLVENDWAAAAGALLFGLHPLQVEAVAWITQGNLLLSTFFGLLSIWLYLRAARSHKAQETEDDGARGLSTRVLHWPLYTAGAFCYLLALLSKPSAVMVPLMIFAILWWKRWIPLRKGALSLLPWLALGAVFVLINQSLQLAPDADIVTPLWARPFLVGDAFAFYLAKLAVPLELTTDYRRMPGLVLANWWGYATWLAPAALLLFVWSRRRAWPWLLAGVLILAVNVLPTSGIVPYYFHKHSTVSDRYLYLGLFGLALILAMAARPLFEAWTRGTSRARLAAVALGIWLMVLGAICFRQTLYWQDSFALWSHLVEVKPDSWRGQTNVAKALWRRDRHEQAMAHFQRALQLNPSNAGMHANLGDAVAARGEIGAAMQHWQDALHLDPQYTDARINLASALKSQGKTEQALRQYREALRQRPESAGAHYNIGIILSEQNQLNAAIEHFRAALRFNPDDAETHNALALALARTDDLSGAAAAWEDALRLDPKLAEAHINYGSLLAMTGRAEAAIPHWETALKLNPKNPQVHHNLATALWAQGKRAPAISHWQEALRLEPNYPAARAALQKAQGKE